MHQSFAALLLTALAGFSQPGHTAPTLSNLSPAGVQGAGHLTSLHSTAQTRGYLCEHGRLYQVDLHQIVIQGQPHWLITAIAPLGAAPVPAAVLSALAACRAAAPASPHTADNDSSHPANLAKKEIFL